MEEPRAIALLPFKERRLPAQQHALGAYQVPGALHTQEVGEVLILALHIETCKSSCFEPRTS